MSVKVRSNVWIAAAAIGLVTGLSACAGQRTVTPKEYLDEQTAATIRVVADPWIFTRDRTADQRDFLNLYAIDVNRMGDHRQYIALLQWLPVDSASATESPMLELKAGERVIALRPTTEDPRKLGIAQPIAQSYSSSKWWYFPVDKEVLSALASSQDLQATFVRGAERIPYAIWRDGRAELVELTEDL